MVIAWLFAIEVVEKVFLIQYKCCIETRFSRCSSQEFAGSTVIVWLIQLRICWHSVFNPSREIFHGDIFLVMLLLSSQDFTGHQEIFYMWEISYALAFTSALHVCLSIYRSILRSCYRKFVFRFWAHRQRVAVVDVIVTGKRELPQVKSQIFVCGGLEICPQKYSHRKKFPGKLSLYQ